MKTAASRLFLIFCLTGQPLWAANPIIEQKPGASNSASGLTGGNPTTGGSNNLGSGSITPQTNTLTGGSFGGVTPTPQVGVNKTVTAAPVAPGSLVTPRLIGSGLGRGSRLA